MIIEPLAKQRRDGFRSGNDVLDSWLHRYAGQNERKDFSRTYLATEGDDVLGYVSIAAGSIARQIAPAMVGRTAPEFIPVVIVTRLAVDLKAQGLGVGRELLIHAFRKAIAVSGLIGARGVLVTTIDDSAGSFYMHVAEFVELESRYSWLFASMRSLRREDSRTT